MSEQAEATTFSALSDDLLLIIFERLASKPSSSFRLCSNFSTLATFSCVSRQCRRVIARSRGWERACRAVFPALNELFPLDAQAQTTEKSNIGTRQAMFKKGEKHTDWAALARVLCIFPGHDVSRNQPVLTVEECNPEALAWEPFQEFPYRIQSSWKEALRRGAAILGPWLARELTMKPVQVFLLQKEDCIADQFYGQTGTKWSFNCFAIFWGFVTGFSVLEKLQSASQRTNSVCPFCPSPMLRIPKDYVADQKIDPQVARGLEPQFFCCRKGHLYGLAACHSYRCEYNCNWTCSGCGGRPYPGQTVSDVLERWAREEREWRGQEEFDSDIEWPV